MKQFWELWVRSMSASKAFYVEVLGFEVEREMSDFIVLRNGSCIVHLCPIDDLPDALHNGTEHGPLGSRVEFVFETEDVEGLHQKLRSAGIEIVESLRDQPWGKTDFRVNDPDGAYIRLTSPQIRPNFYMDTVRSDG